MDTQALLQEAIAAVKAGNKARGRTLLARVLQADPRNEQAWLWMSKVVETDEQWADCLRQVLAINPSNEFAREGLRLLAEESTQQSPRQPAREPKAQQTRRTKRERTNRTPLIILGVVIAASILGCVLLLIALLNTQDVPSVVYVTATAQARVITTQHAPQSAEQQATATAVAQTRINAALKTLPGNSIQLSGQNSKILVGVNSLKWKPGVSSRPDEHLGVLVHIYAQNLGGRSIHVNPGYFTAVDINGRAYNYSTYTFELSDHLEAIDVPSGSFTMGWLEFDIYDKVPAKIVYDDGFNAPIVLNVLDWITSHPAIPTPTPRPTPTPAYQSVRIDKAIFYGEGDQVYVVSFLDLKLYKDSSLLTIRWRLPRGTSGYGLGGPEVGTWEIIQGSQHLKLKRARRSETKVISKDPLEEEWIMEFPPLSSQPKQITIRYPDGYFVSMSLGGLQGYSIDVTLP